MSRQRKRFSLEEIDERRKQLDRLALCDSREQLADWYGDVADMLLQLLVPAAAQRVAELERTMVERRLVEDLQLVPASPWPQLRERSQTPVPLTTEAREGEQPVEGDSKLSANSVPCLPRGEANATQGTPGEGDSSPTRNRQTRR